jgi:hypothetical protein
MGLLHFFNSHRAFDYMAAALPSALFEVRECPFQIGVRVELLTQHQRILDRNTSRRTFENAPAFAVLSKLEC